MFAKWCDVVFAFPGGEGEKRKKKKFIYMPSQGCPTRGPIEGEGGKKEEKGRRTAVAACTVSRQKKREGGRGKRERDSLGFFVLPDKGEKKEKEKKVSAWLHCNLFCLDSAEVINEEKGKRETLISSGPGSESKERREKRKAFLASPTYGELLRKERRGKKGEEGEKEAAYLACSIRVLISTASGRQRGKKKKRRKREASFLYIDPPHWLGKEKKKRKKTFLLFNSRDGMREGGKRRRRKKKKGRAASLYITSRPPGAYGQGSEKGGRQREEKGEREQQVRKVSDRRQAPRCTSQEGRPKEEEEKKEGPGPPSLR